MDIDPAKQALGDTLKRFKSPVDSTYRLALAAFGMIDGPDPASMTS